MSATPGERHACGEMVPYGGGLLHKCPTRVSCIAPIRVRAEFSPGGIDADRLPVDGPNAIETREVTLDLHVYTTREGEDWLSVYMHGGPTGYESFSLLEGYPHLREGWLACMGTHNSWKRCFVPAAEMERAFHHWGAR